MNKDPYSSTVEGTSSSKPYSKCLFLSLAHSFIAIFNTQLLIDSLHNPLELLAKKNKDDLPEVVTTISILIMKW